MGLELTYGAGQTPVDEEEKEGLRILTINTRAELNEHEQLNIEEAIRWILENRFDTERILAEELIRRLHFRMFRHVWKWAGEFRRSNKNIGVDWTVIPVELKMLMDDTRYWIKEATYPPDETAIRFKHRLVSIHCFPNGNGRHSRLMADVMAKNVFGLPAFTWGGDGWDADAANRKKYIDALRAADAGDIQPLMDFARS